MRRFAPLLATLAAALAAATAAAPASARDRAVCGHSGYSYAGLTGTAVANAAAATITLNSVPQVDAGHVAAWVGFGGYGAGRGGTNAWIQVGIITKVGQAPQLYYELTRPGAEPELVLLGSAAVGRAYRVVAYERAQAGWWRVAVDGKAVSPPVFLPGSHDSWQATAVTETWDGGVQSCNGFDVGFDTIAVRRSSGAWEPLRGVALDAPGYRIAGRTASSFRALG